MIEADQRRWPRGRQPDRRFTSGYRSAIRVAVTRILVVGDLAASRDFRIDVLGAELYREYGGTSVVLKFAGTWLLLVSGGGPTAWSPGSPSGRPRTQIR
jgi:hypothetical protein